jgi:hypothetical protein
MLGDDFSKDLVQFEKRFGSEEQCCDHLYKTKFPVGLVCPKCRGKEYWWTARNLMYCKQCHQCVTRKRVRSEERETILVSVQNGKNQADRAKALGRNQSSLLRELAGGLEKRAYNPFLAQREIEKGIAHQKLSLKIDAQT